MWALGYILGSVEAFTVLQNCAKRRLNWKPGRARGRGSFRCGNELAGNEGMEKNMETTIMGYVGSTKGIHSLSFLANQRPGIYGFD